MPRKPTVGLTLAIVAVVLVVLALGPMAMDIAASLGAVSSTLGSVK